MELNENAQIDTGQVQDRRGSGFGVGGVSIPLPSGRGGLITTLIVVALALFGGGLFGANQLGGDGDTTDIAQACAQGNPDRLTKTECRNTLFVNSIQAYWTTALPRYQPAQTVFYSRAVSTGCGSADSGVGPFYCPADHHVYIDLSFWNLLADRFGADGEFAQPYVLAHEYGHHVQSLLGTEASVRRAQQRDPGNANRYSVLLELQADCYAGVWARHATETTDAGGQPIFKNLTREDRDQALEAAAAVGDDAIARKSGSRIDESNFTHGTSAQRQQWFGRGFDTGDPESCDTFGNTI